MRMSMIKYLHIRYSEKLQARFAGLGTGIFGAPWLEAADSCGAPSGLVLRACGPWAVLCRPLRGLGDRDLRRTVVDAHRVRLHRRPQPWLRSCILCDTLEYNARGRLYQP